VHINGISTIFKITKIDLQLTGVFRFTLAEKEKERKEEEKEKEKEEK
jgi:hypothetical protein